MSFYIIQCICFFEFYINIMLMRKFLSFFFVMAFYVVGAYAQVLVQGQPHPSARNISTKQESQLRADASFTFDDIQYWVGNGSNKAALVIEWHDGNRPDAMVWGYRWDGEATGHDMIVAIAQADPRLVLLTQYTGWMGYTIDGIGYGESRLNISYDLEGAKSEPKNAFKFEPPITNPLLGQTSHPEHPAEDVAAAIRQGVQTGVIYHPINAERYGYPSYDYDYWSCSNGIHWQAGWYYGYWSYFVRSSQTSNFSYSGLGATSRVLTDGCWDAWSWNGNMNTSEGTQPGDVFVAATIPSGGGGDEPEIPVIHVTSISLNKSSLRLQAGANAILAASISPVNADNKQVIWSSSDTGIATVENGVVTGVKPGVVKITAQSVDGGYTAVCEVTITEVVIPESVTSMGDWAFWHCQSLKRITFPDRMVRFGEWAFYENESLQSVCIPEGVTTIPSSAFARCHNLTCVIMPGSLQTICGGAFSQCHKLTDVTIPDGVTVIETGAFPSYLDMAVVTCLAVIPPELGKDNFGFPAKILYVPAGSVEVYRKNAVWREAFETIAALP